MSSHLSVLCAHYLSGMGLSFALSLHRNLAPLDKANVCPTITPPLPEAASPSWCLVLSSLLWKRDAGIFCSQRIYPLSDSRKSGSLFITRASLPLKLAVGSCEPSVCPSVTRSSRAIAHLRPRRLLAYLGYVLGIIPSTLDLGMLLSNLVGRGSHSPMTHNKLAGIMACI